MKTEKRLDIAIQTIMVLCITVVVYTGFIYICKAAWFFYSATPIGQRFMTVFAGNTTAILDTLDIVSIRFSIEIILIALGTCLIISAICRVFYITRFLYKARGLAGRMVLWGLPLTAVVATKVYFLYGGEWSVSYGIAFIPTLCLFSTCFKLADRTLPVAGDLIQNTVWEAKDKSKKIWEILKKAGLLETGGKEIETKGKVGEADTASSGGKLLTESP